MKDNHRPRRRCTAKSSKLVLVVLLFLVITIFSFLHTSKNITTTINATTNQTSMMMMMSYRSSAIDKAIQQLKQVGINLLAIDFDQTIIDIHTYGRWTGTMEELKEHVRPEFRQLLNAAMESDLQVAIVTFSKQVALVKEIIETVVGADQAARIPVRGGDRTWTYNGVGSREGKQAHIASAVEELEQSGEIEIAKQTTVLIDDDRKNIRISIKDGVRAIWFNPDKPHHLFRDLARLV